MLHFAGFTDSANQALNLALAESEKLGHTCVGTEHLLFGLADVSGGVSSLLLSRSGIGANELENKLVSVVGKGTPQKLSPDDFTPRVRRIMSNALEEAARMEQNNAGTEHLLLAFLMEEESYGLLLLQEMGAAPKELYTECLAQLYRSEPEKPETAPGGKTKLIARYCTDLVELARRKKIDPVIGRDRETAHMIRILTRRSKNNPCLIGEPGVGKTAVVEGLALRIAAGRVPESLCRKRILSLDLTSMLAGAKYRGDFEERMKGVLDEAKRDRSIILFLDELHTIIGAGAAEGAIDAANILKPPLARGEVQLIGATTTPEYRKQIEKDAALERRFQPIDVEEPNEQQALAILKGLRPKYEAFHKVQISDAACRAAVTLSVRYIHDRFLPDKAIDLMDEAASELCIRRSEQPSAEQETIQDRINRAVAKQDFETAARLRDEEKKRQKLGGCAEVTPEDVAAVASGWVGIPASKLNQSERERLLLLEETLHKRVVGQQKAVQAIARAIRRSRAGIASEQRPIGCFLFLGPSGVGKTALCRALAEALFGDEHNLIRLDMSEYMEPHSVSKIIGSPPGYVGFEEGGKLTEQVRRRPYSVVLFDEIEKAHPDVCHLLLQLMDDGILTDSQGRKVDFCNTVIILTSNLAADKLGKSGLGFSPSEPGPEHQQAIVRAELRKAFRPEFLNRLDEILIFDPLNRQELSEIAGQLLEQLTQRLQKLNVLLSFDQKAVDRILLLNNEPGGARPLRRIIARQVEDLLSDSMFKNEIAPGQQLLLTADDSGFCIRQATAVAG